MNNIIQFPSKKEGRFDFMTKADFEKYGKIPFVILQSMHERIQEEVHCRVYRTYLPFLYQEKDGREMALLPVYNARTLG